MVLPLPLPTVVPVEGGWKVPETCSGRMAEGFLDSPPSSFSSFAEPEWEWVAVTFSECGSKRVRYTAGWWGRAFSFTDDAGAVRPSPIAAPVCDNRRYFSWSSGDFTKRFFPMTITLLPIVGLAGRGSASTTLFRFEEEADEGTTAETPVLASLPLPIMAITRDRSHALSRLGVGPGRGGREDRDEGSSLFVAVVRCSGEVPPRWLGEEGKREGRLARPLPCRVPEGVTAVPRGRAFLFWPSSSLSEEEEATTTTAAGETSKGGANKQPTILLFSFPPVVEAIASCCSRCRSIAAVVDSCFNRPSATSTEVERRR